MPTRLTNAGLTQAQYRNLRLTLVGCTFFCTNYPLPGVESERSLGSKESISLLRGSTFRGVRGDRSCHAKPLKHTPLFFPGHFLSGSDNGRDRLIRAWFGLPWYSRYLALSGDSRTILRRDFVAGSESNSGRKMGDFTSFNRVQDQRSKLVQYLLKLILRFRFSVEPEQRLGAAGPN